MADAKLQQTYLGPYRVALIVLSKRDLHSRPTRSDRHDRAVDVTVKGTGTLLGKGYEQGQAIVSTPEEIFVWLSDFGNSPQYLIPP